MPLQEEQESTSLSQNLLEFLQNVFQTNSRLLDSIEIMNYPVPQTNILGVHEINFW